MQLTDRPLFFWVLKRHRGLQIVLLLIIVVSLFFRVFPLEMQRKIINVAINLKMLDRLYLYCALYIGAVLIAGALKYCANILTEIIGQKVLITMRQELYQHMLRLPLTFFHRTQTGTIVSAMTAELNAIASFLGGALTTPITALLTFVVFLGFMIYLNPLLGLLTIIIYPFELLVIPILQSWYNRFNRQRVATIRQMASLVNESVSGIHEVQANAAFPLEQSKLDRLIHRLYELALKLALFKYGIKFSNNLFQSLGPFLLFLVGGYLAIKGEFTIGALVAFLSAYEKVYDPWKEVIEYYQSFQDAKVRYRQIMELFSIQPQHLLALPDRPARTFDGALEAKNIGYRINDIKILEGVSFQVPAGDHLALIGFSGSGKSTLALLVGQLYRQNSGSLTIDGCEISTLSGIEVAGSISSVSQQPFIFTGTVRENLLYATNALVLNEVRETMPSRAEVFEIIKAVGLTDDVIRWALRSILPPQRVEPMITSVLRMRAILRDKLHGERLRSVEFYDLKTFLQHSTIASNIMFGTYGLSYSTKKLLGNQRFRTFLSQVGLERSLIEFGHRIATTTITMLGNLSGDEFFFKGSPLPPQQLDHYKTLLQKAGDSSLHALRAKDLDRFLLLALKFTPGTHKIASISPAFEMDILAARRQFLQQVVGVDLEACVDGTLQKELAPYRPGPTDGAAEPVFTPFCVTQYLYAQSLHDNILFGNVIDQERLQKTFGTLIIDELERQGLLDDVMDIGLDFHVGGKGDNLSGGQKQKIALARALLKRCPVLILDEATASLDNTSQARIQQYVRDRLHGVTTVIAVVHRLDIISEYDHILVMKEGKIVESGNYDELLQRKGILYGLINDQHER